MRPGEDKRLGRLAMEELEKRLQERIAELSNDRHPDAYTNGKLSGLEWVLDLIQK